jgi:glutaredoxin 3
MIQVYQAEWCPYSHLVRQKLTELGVDFVCRQVEPNPRDRTQLKELSGQRGIPVVVLEDGRVLSGETEQIVATLDSELPHWEHEAGHVAQAHAHGVRRAS